MANPKDLGKREVLLTEGAWRLVRVSWRGIDGTSAPYMEHSCDDGAGWMWCIRSTRDITSDKTCGHCNQQPPDGMVVMLLFLRDNEG